MIDLLLQIVDYYTTHFSTNLVDYTDYAIFYGWMAGASAVTALITLITVLTRRDSGQSLRGGGRATCTGLGLPLFGADCFGFMGAGIAALNFITWATETTGLPPRCPCCPRLIH